MNSPKFKDVISPSKRNTLLKMVKSQNVNQTFQNQSFMQGENSYYVDTLQGMSYQEDDGPITINRAQHSNYIENQHL